MQHIVRQCPGLPEKRLVHCDILQCADMEKAIVVCNTAHIATILATYLAQRNAPDTYCQLHRDMTSSERDQVVDDYMNNKYNHLVLDDLHQLNLIDAGINVVICYEVPVTFTQYLHRMQYVKPNGRLISLLVTGDTDFARWVTQSEYSQIRHP